MSQDAEAVIARAHRTISAQAAVAKRTIAANRRILGESKQMLAELETEADRLGLALHIDDTDQKGHSQ